MADIFKDILPDLNYKKDHLIRSGEMSEDNYDRSRFIVNKAFSMMPDTIFYANEMNHFYSLDSLLQYDYLINSLRTKKRYSKWAKTSTDADIEIIKQVYNYSNQKAFDVLPLLSSEQLDSLRAKMDKGGNNEFYEKCRADP